MKRTGLWDIKGSEEYSQMKASQETTTEANIEFGHALMPSYLVKHPPKAAFFQFSDAAMGT